MLEKYTQDGGKGFYPTPQNLADRMLDQLNFSMCYTFLEPSAGKGDLALAIMKRYNREHYLPKGAGLRIDCVEIDPYLRQILKYNFSDEAIQPIYDEITQLNHSTDIDTESRWKKEQKLRGKLDEYKGKENVRVVYDDFLTFWPEDKYDAIVMNPPFEAGAAHLNHAIEIAQKDGGTIVCLLNAETLRNPCDNHRKKLLRSIQQYEAKVEFIQNAFTQAERQTDVEIAMVTFKIPAPQKKSFIFSKLEEAEKQKQDENAEYKELISADPIEAAIVRYNMEVKASIKLIDEYEAMKPYITEDMDSSVPIIKLVAARSDDRCYSAANSVSKNQYLAAVRKKYWSALFKNEQFTGMLTSNLRKKYSDMVRELANYEFNHYNINRVKVEMMAEMVDGVKETIMNLFDKLSAAHSWYPETQNNVHYFDGWATNKAHKINKKVIIPVYGIFSHWDSKSRSFDDRVAYEFLADIEKALNYLDGGMTAEVELKDILQTAARAKQTKKIQCKYFSVTFYKKGTVHIAFSCPDLIDKFNIYASRQRGWLPPNYGKKKYDEMSQEEQTVIDNFQGRKAYEEIMARADYYISSGTEFLMLPSAS